MLQSCIPRRAEDKQKGIENRTLAKRKINEDLFEADPSGKPCIEVKNLRKVFRSLTGKHIYGYSENRNDITLMFTKII